MTRDAHKYHSTTKFWKSFVLLNFMIASDLCSPYDPCVIVLWSVRFQVVEIYSHKGNKLAKNAY